MSTGIFTEPADTPPGLAKRVTQLEADMTQLWDRGLLDSDEDRDDSLGRLDRELTRRRSDRTRWAAFHRSCPTGTAAGLSEAFQFPPPPFGDGAGINDDDHELAAHAASWEGV